MPSDFTKHVKLVQTLGRTFKQQESLDFSLFHGSSLYITFLPPKLIVGQQLSKLIYQMAHFLGIVASLSDIARCSFCPGIRPTIRYVSVKRLSTCIYDQCLTMFPNTPASNRPLWHLVIQSKSLFIIHFSVGQSSSFFFQIRGHTVEKFLPKISFGDYILSNIR
jgi:hypothetical protein